MMGVDSAQCNLPMLLLVLVLGTQCVWGAADSDCYPGNCPLPKEPPRFPTRIIIEKIIKCDDNLQSYRSKFVKMGGEVVIECSEESWENSVEDYQDEEDEVISISWQFPNCSIQDEWVNSKTNTSILVSDISKDDVGVYYCLRLRVNVSHAYHELHKIELIATSAAAAVSTTTILLGAVFVVVFLAVILIAFPMLRYKRQHEKKRWDVAQTPVDNNDVVIPNPMAARIYPSMALGAAPFVYNIRDVLKGQKRGLANVKVVYVHSEDPSLVIVNDLSEKPPSWVTHRDDRIRTQSLDRGGVSNHSDGPTTTLDRIRHRPEDEIYVPTYATIPRSEIYVSSPTVPNHVKPPLPPGPRRPRGRYTSDDWERNPPLSPQRDPERRGQYPTSREIAFPDRVYAHVGKRRRRSSDSEEGVKTPYRASVIRMDSGISNRSTDMLITSPPGRSHSDASDTSNYGTLDSRITQDSTIDSRRGLTGGRDKRPPNISRMNSSGSTDSHDVLIHSDANNRRFFVADV